MTARLPSAVDIAAMRVWTLRTQAGGEAMHKTLTYQRELARARDELARGEWIAPSEGESE